MTIFEFLDIKREILDVLSKQTDDSGRLVADVKYAEGTVRSRKDGDYRKQGGKWVKVYSGTGRGASLAVTHAVKKIKAAKSVDELMDLVNNNISRFYDKNGKLLPVVARLKDAVNESKTRINAERKASKEAEKAEPSTTAPQETLETLSKKIKDNLEARNQLAADYEKKLSELPDIGKEWKDRNYRVQQELKKPRLKKERREELLQEELELSKEWRVWKAEHDESKRKLEEETKAKDRELTTEGRRLDAEHTKLKRQLAAESEKKEPSTAAPASTQAATPSTPKLLQKPDVISEGRWNGKIYGNEKYGYRVYVDNKEKKISKEQKAEIESYLQEQANRAKEHKAQAETQAKENEALRGLFYGLDRLPDIAVEKKIKNPDYMESWKNKSADETLFTERKMQLFEQEARGAEAKAIVERLKTDKDFRERAKNYFISLVEERVNDRKKEADKEAAYKSKDQKIDDYIKAHGTPDIVKGGFWNGKVYGSANSGYSVYVDGKKKYLKGDDLKQFGLAE